MLDAAPDAFVHLRFARDVSSDELAGRVAAQGIASLLAATNRIPVSAGDAILCPAGMPHAIGENVLVITGGHGELSGEWGAIPIARGMTAVVPQCAGTCQIRDDVSGVRCRPAE